MKISLNNRHKNVEKNNRMEVFELSLTRRLQDKYAPRSYAERWAMVRFAALLSSFLFNAYSFVTGAGAIILFVLLSAKLSILTITITTILAVAFAVLLEVFKRKTAGETFSQGYSSGSWSASGIAGMVLIMGISIALSFSASYLLPEASLAAPTRPTIDQTQEQIYKESIAHKKSQAAAIKTQREWKGRIGHKDQEEINKLNAQIAKLEGDLLAHRSAAAAQADTKYREALAEHESKIDRNQYIGGFITIATEILFFFCFWYMEYYDWKSTLERMELDAANTSNSNSTPTPSAGGAGYTAGPTPTSGGGSPGPTHHSVIDRVVVKGYVNDPSDHYEENNAVHIPYDELDANRTEIVTPENIEEIEVSEKITDDETYIVGDGTQDNTMIVELVLQPNQKPCEYCGEVMTYKATRKKFCSEKCKWAAFEARKEVKL